MKAKTLISVGALGTLCIGAFHCSSNPPAQPPPQPAPSASAPAAPAGPAVEKVSMADVGLDAFALDRSVDPCTDFYQFACGGWLKNTKIPGDRARWSRGFSEIHKRNQATLKEILEAAQKNQKASGADGKLGGYYGACMDEAAADKAGTKAIEDLLTAAKGTWSKKAKLATLVAKLHKAGVWALFDISDDQDFKDATKVIATLDQNGLGLPDRDYYFPTEKQAKRKKILEAYKQHIVDVLVAGGEKPKAAKRARDGIIKLETALAKVSKTRIERRDPKGIYNKIDRKGLLKDSPKFDWEAYFKELGAPGLTQINVTSVPFFKGMSKLIQDTPMRTLQAYFKFHILSSYAGVTTKKLDDLRFKMVQMLTGQKVRRPRYKRCIAATDRALGEVLAQPYIKAKFAGSSKDAAEKMIGAITKAFANNLESLSWMDKATKAKAAEKLKMMAYLIGYPDKWKDYDFQIKAGDYAGNVRRSQAHRLGRKLKKIGKPLDRNEWQMSPPTVNAYYDPLKNHMVFPAGILQPPFYSEKAHTPVNLGAMGMVVGHELTHGFDDQGSQFAGNGNLKNWWSPKVGAEFKQKTSCVVSQFDKYEPVKGVHLKGKLTLGENIADLGGLKLAFAAYRSMRAGAASVKNAEGFTEDQQFFLAAGQAWCTKATEELLRLRAQTDPHSPPKFRVNGPMSNLPEFAEAFACKEGTPMRPKNRCDVW